MSTLNAGTMVEAKQAFEQTADQHGLHIKHYHADNGQFIMKAF